MHASPHGETPASFTGCPPVTPEEIQQGETEATLTQREFIRGGLKVLGLMAAYGTGALPVIKIIDDLYEKTHWPARPARFDLVPGAERLGKGGRLNVVFPGFGQTDGYAAASELFAAKNGSEKVAALFKPPQGYDALDVANPLSRLIDEHQPDSMVLYCVSMGDVLGLETMQYIVRHDKRRPGKSLAQSLPPPIDHIVLLSSPSDKFDAIAGGPVADALVSFGQAIDYGGGPIGKFAFDSYTQFHRDPQLDKGMQGAVELFSNTMQEVNNNCPPKMAWSDIKFLFPFSIDKQASRYRIITNPPRTKLVYIKTETDDIVNYKRAIRIFGANATQLGVEMVVLSSGNINHANTIGGAHTYGEWDNGQTA